jgi:FeS assembly protein IscX
LQQRLFGERNPDNVSQGAAMPGTFGWEDAEEIGIQLSEKYPDTDPLTVRFTDLHKWITSLEGFNGDPKLSNEGKLEAIQMAWLEEYRDRQGT